MISLCVGIKNRKDNLINYLISSMNLCIDKHLLGLSIFDCGSSDTENLVKDIKQYWEGEIIYKQIECAFSRTVSFNGAVKLSRNEKIFTCDTDMTLPIDFVEQYNKNVAKKVAWFPVCFSLHRNKPRVISDENGWWRHAGYGMCGFLKEDYLSLGGGYDERFNKWGAEDEDLCRKALRAKFKINRTHLPGLFHNWHERDTEWHKK